MFGLFKKKHTSSEIGSALAQFATPSQEQINFCLNSLDIINEKGDVLDETKYNFIINKLFLEILILKLFTIDYTCFSVFGKSDLSNRILDEMYLVVFRSIEDTFTDSNFNLNAYFEETKNKILEYSNIINNKKEMINIEGIGFQFSKNVLDEIDILLSLGGTSVFTSTSIPTKNFLKDIKIKP